MKSYHFYKGVFYSYNALYLNKIYVACTVKYCDIISKMKSQDSRQKRSKPVTDVRQPKIKSLISSAYERPVH